MDEMNALVGPSPEEKQQFTMTTSLSSSSALSYEEEGEDSFMEVDLKLRGELEPEQALDFLEIEVDEDQEEDNDQEGFGDEFDDSSTTPVATTSRNTRHNRRRFRRFRRMRITDPSWWSECRNIDITGSSFAFFYVVVSFFLMTTMFNMREIVGDYLVGNKEAHEQQQLLQQEYFAMEQKQQQQYEGLDLGDLHLRRRSPYDEAADQEDRFEEEMEADLYYDRQGLAAQDNEYHKHHRVPLMRSEDELEEEEPN